MKFLEWVDQHKETAAVMGIFAVVMVRSVGSWFQR